MAPTAIEITQTLLRLYIFLAQLLDRCLDEQARREYPDQELQAHLAKARDEMQKLLSVNRVVAEKVEQECRRTIELARTGAGGGAEAVERLKTERNILKEKTIALSDLLAVFRATPTGELR